MSNYEHDDDCNEYLRVLRQQHCTCCRISTTGNRRCRCEILENTGVKLKLNSVLLTIKTTNSSFICSCVCICMNQRPPYFHGIHAQKLNSGMSYWFSKVTLRPCCEETREDLPLDQIKALHNQSTLSVRRSLERLYHCLIGTSVKIDQEDWSNGNDVNNN